MRTIPTIDIQLSTTVPRPVQESYLPEAFGNNSVALPSNGTLRAAAGAQHA